MEQQPQAGCRDNVVTEIPDRKLLAAHDLAICELLEVAGRLEALMDAQLEGFVPPSPRGSRLESLVDTLEGIADPAMRSAHLDELYERISNPAVQKAQAGNWLHLKYELGAAAKRLVEAEEALHGDMQVKLYPAPGREQ